MLLALARLQTATKSTAGSPCAVARQNGRVLHVPGTYVDHWKPRYPGAPDALRSAAGRWLTALAGNSTALAGRAMVLPFWRLRPLVV